MSHLLHAVVLIFSVIASEAQAVPSTGIRRLGECFMAMITGSKQPNVIEHETLRYGMGTINGDLLLGSMSNDRLIAVGQQMGILELPNGKISSKSKPATAKFVADYLAERLNERKDQAKDDAENLSNILRKTPEKDFESALSVWESKHTDLVGVKGNTPSQIHEQVRNGIHLISGPMLLNYITPARMLEIGKSMEVVKGPIPHPEQAGVARDVAITLAQNIRSREISARKDPESITAILLDTPAAEFSAALAKWEASHPKNPPSEFELVDGILRPKR